MIQTYEGALTETDSILQRMKTLADQAANGTYQDDVDRDAIQLEFNQLNDELDQIADTDFNGVVVLNGGQMADGTKAVAGKFDYENQVRQTKQLSASSKEFGTLENKTWDSTADDAWATWSASGGAYDRSDPSKAQGPDSVDITFTYKGDGTWEATGVTDGGMTLDDINGTIAYDRQTAQTDASNGGFVLKNGTNEYANVLVDGTNLVAGDKITLTFKNPAVKNTAPENAGVATDGVDATGMTELGTTPAELDNVSIKVTNTKYSSTNNATSDAITKEVADLFKDINEGTLSVTYTAGKVTQVVLNGSNNLSSITATDTGANIVDADGNVLGKIKTDDATNTTKVTIEDANGSSMMEIDLVAGDSTGANKTAGTVKYTLATDDVVYNEGALPTVSVKDNGDTSVSEANAYGQASAPLTYTDHIILQSGARTKDAVDFTFKYTSGGMGDLKANMNCSSREDGLNTANLSLSTQKDANYAIDRIDNAINKVSMVRATFGAVQNRLEHKIDNMSVTKENLTSAESRIRDTNMAEEMTNFTKNQILSQASQAMLAQANQLPQGVLQLLG